jgi:hypothetical protein
MLIDHIGLYFFEYELGWSLILRMIGRLSYPLFLFCMVWGYHYTRNRKAYLLRLYLGSLFMSAFVTAVDYFFPTESGIGNHNIFLPMFIVGVLISTIEIFQKDRKKGAVLLGAIVVAQILFMPTGKFLEAIFPFVPGGFSGDIITGIMPNLYENEYGLEFIILGVLMYFLKGKKDFFCVMYILFCIVQFTGELAGLPTQWMMIGALPLMMRYNNEKGSGMKYFFYIFYPAHAFILFYLANFVFQ